MIIHISGHPILYEIVYTKIPASALHPAPKAFAPVA